MERNGKSRRRASLMLTMDPESKERLRKMAEQRHMTISAMIVDYAWKTRLKPDPVPDEAE